MKIQILDIEGKKVKEISTDLFNEPVREDIIYKIVETEKITQPYRTKARAGMDISASGKVKRKRHSWGSDRGRGMSRIPKKTMWRRGTQFSWIGAIVPGTRGGRRAHPPKGINKIKKINKKEYVKAMLSCLSYVNSTEEIKNKYMRLKDKQIDVKLPIVVDEKILKLKTKELFNSLKKILGELYPVSIQVKKQRAGIGKLRGRRYKKNSGALIVLGNKENLKVSGIDVYRVNDLTVSDFANNGSRITIFSENAIKDLEKNLLGVGVKK
ncbi:50S ribosomal protein L4 [Candidatus Pacearchaeota archaeon]|nr:50S ribosomal protein L4 [Candidatus Pacearchaeota archaeon]